MSRVADILSGKGSEVITVAPDTTIRDAVERMVRHGIGAVVVIEGIRVTGVFSERDYLTRVALAGLDQASTPVSAVMTADPLTVDPERSVEDCMAVMTHARIRHLPVTDGGRLAGMVSIGDLVKHVSDERAVEIRHLTDYISGRFPV